MPTLNAPPKNETLMANADTYKNETLIANTDTHNSVTYKWEKGTVARFLPESPRRLTRKEKALRYIAHAKAPRLASLCVIIPLIFIVLVMLGFVPAGKYPQNASAETLYAHSAGGADDVAFAGVFVGDVMMGRSVLQSAKAYGYDHLFEYTKDFFRDFDYVLCNFENPILDSNAEYEGADKEVHLSAEKDCLPALKDAGFTFFGLANNHTMDFGASGLAYTLEALQDSGITYIGCGEDAEEAARFVITESGGAKIASIAVSDVGMPGFSATNIAPGVLSTTGEDPLYLQTIREAKRAADIVIVIMHWGVEYTSQISENQQHLARQMIDAGADIIIGSHPHALQSAEIYNNGIVFYSLGNFVFDQGWNRTKDSCILRYCLSSSGQGVFEVVPVRIASAVPSETANAVFANRIFHTLTKELAETDYILENNRLYIYPPVIATT